MGSSRLDHQFSPERFRENGHGLIDRLADFLEASLARKIETVLPHIDPDAMLTRWKGEFCKEGGETFDALVERVLKDSINLQHPRYVGHQCCTPLPLAALCDLVGSFINNGTAVYEMGPVEVAMERRLIEWMAGLIGYEKKAGGVFTHGGTLGNLTALLAARQVKTGYDIWSQGADSAQPLGVLVSAQAHYSVKRAVAIMGLGEEGVFLVNANEGFQMEEKDLKKKHQEALDQGRRVIALVGNSCSTATGTYDDLNMLADFAKAHDLWLHVDGAHGASALVSKKHAHLLQGAHRADSLVWDAHKMMMTPALSTAVIFKDRRHSFQAFSQKASYLFEKEAPDEWYNFAHQTMECTKAMLAMKLYIPLAVCGEGVFEDFVDRTYDLCLKFYRIIEASSDFESPVAPQSNIICFRRTHPKEQDLDALQLRIRRAVKTRGRFYMVQTQLNNRMYLRCTLINPNTTIEDLEELLDHIRAI